MANLRLGLVYALALGLLVDAQTTVTVVPSSSTVTIIPASTITLEESVVACPAAPTVYVNFTETAYIESTTTALQAGAPLSTETVVVPQPVPAPTTIYQNLISTEYVTIVSTDVTSFSTVLTSRQTQNFTAYQTVVQTQYTTESSYLTAISLSTATEIAYSTAVAISLSTATETSYATETTVKPSVLTLTASEELLVYSSTSTGISIKICPSRTLNPTFTVAQPMPTDWTWGCPPGWLCKPSQHDCNFEAGIPDENFYCAPNECIPASALPAAQEWNTDIYGNFTPLNTPGLSYNAVDSYFNMNPQQYGLNYEIFTVSEVVEYTSTIVHQPTQTVAARQAITNVPGVCYPWCNNCLLEAQSSGKNPNLCMPGSSFETGVESCQECIVVHKADDSGEFVQVAPQFQQFINYCANFYTTTCVSSYTSAARVLPYTLVTVVPSGSSITLISTTSTLIPSTVKAAPTSSSLSSIAVPTTASVSFSATVVPIVTDTAVGPSSTSTYTSYNVTLFSSVISSASATSLPVVVSTTVPAGVNTSTYATSSVPSSSLSQVTIILTYSSTTTTIVGPNISGLTMIMPTSGNFFGASSSSPTACSSGQAVSTVTVGSASSSDSDTPAAPAMSTSPASFQGAAASISSSMILVSAVVLGLTAFLCP